ncbi:MAG: hypothetical protein ABUK17_10545, partial [Syntrophobacteria bacterium]
VLPDECFKDFRRHAEGPMLPEKTLLLQIEAVPASHVAERADRLCYDGVLWPGVIVQLGCPIAFALSVHRFRVQRRL